MTGAHTGVSDAVAVDEAVDVAVADEPKVSDADGVADDDGVGDDDGEKAGACATPRKRIFVEHGAATREKAREATSKRTRPAEDV